MLNEIIFISIIVAFITIKLKDISVRQQLNQNKERRLILSGGLVVLFLLSSLTFPFPQSLYWFIVLGILFLVVLISSDIVKLEWRRQLSLPFKERIINLSFYSLLFVFINIYI